MPTLQETIRKVREFGELAEGWHFGEGVAPSADRITEAIKFLTLAEYLGAARANAFPGVIGQIEITFYGEGSMLEITFEADGSLTLAEDENDEQVFFLENITRGDAFEKLWEFTHGIWASSELFIENILTRNVRVQVLPARHLIFGPASLCPLLTTTAHWQKAVGSVGTFVGTMAVKLGNPQSTGLFWTNLFPQNVAQPQRRLWLGMNAIGTYTAGDEVLSEEFLSV